MHAQPCPASQTASVLTLTWTQTYKLPPTKNLRAILIVLWSFVNTPTPELAGSDMAKRVSFCVGFSFGEPQKQFSDTYVRHTFWVQRGPWWRAPMTVGRYRSV